LKQHLRINKILDYLNNNQWFEKESVFITPFH
jgi:hypothetical protein